MKSARGAGELINEMVVSIILITHIQFSSGFTEKATNSKWHLSHFHTLSLDCSQTIVVSAGVLGSNACRSLIEIVCLQFVCVCEYECVNILLNSNVAAT